MYYRFVRIHQTPKVTRNGRWRHRSVLGHGAVVNVLEAFEAAQPRMA
jgi:hypothetical protein